MAGPQAGDVKQRISAIWENLQCPICLDLMSMPVTTKCDHQFCKFCMQKLLDRSRRREANCPVCKTKVTKRSLQESTAFQRLVSELQKLVEAYEYDTCTNYFTGLAQRRKSGSYEVRQQTEEFVDMETPEPDVKRGADGSAPSMTSSRAAKDAFAQLMDLGDSCSATSDSGLGHLPEASKAEFLCSSVHKDDDFSTPAVREDDLPSETVDLPLLVEGGQDQSVAAEDALLSSSRPRQQSAAAEEAGSPAEPERVVVHAKRQTRSSRILVAKHHSGDEEEKVVLRRSSRTNRTLGLDVDRIVDGRQKRSLEKVSEWLLRFPTEGPIADDQEKQQSTNLRQDNQPENEHVLGGSSSSSYADTDSLANQMMERPANHMMDRPANQNEKSGRALEEQVFGAVYSRGRKSSGVQWKSRASLDLRAAGILPDPEQGRTEISAVPEQDPLEISAVPDRDPSEISAAPDPRGAPEDPELQAQGEKLKRKRRSSALTPADFIKRPCLVAEPEPEPEPVLEESAAQDPDGSGPNTLGSIPGEEEPELGSDPKQRLPEARSQDGERSASDGSAFEVNTRTRKQQTRKAKMQGTWTDLDSALTSDVQGRHPKRYTRSKRTQRDEKTDERMPLKATRALMLVSAGGEHRPLEVQASRVPQRNAEAQIESYPSSWEALSPVPRVTRRSRRLLDFTEEVQGVPRSTRAVGAPAGDPDHSNADEVQGVTRRTRAAIAKALTTDRTSPDHSHPDRTSPDHSHPDRTSPDHSHPDRTSPDHSHPDRTSPDHSHPDRYSPDHSHPDRTSPDHSHPDRTSHTSGKAEAVTPGHSSANFAEEVQNEPMRTRDARATVSIERHSNTGHPTDDMDHGDRTGVSRSPQNQPGPAPRRNGCVCEREIDDIEEMEVVGESALSEARDETQLAAVVPHTQTPTPTPRPTPAAVQLSSGSLLDAVVPHSRSPAEADFPFSPPGISLQRSPPAPVGAPEVVFQTEHLDTLGNPTREPVSPNVVEEVVVEEVVVEESNDDSELDTELLLKSFRGSKRKSFHLGPPCHQAESPRVGMPDTPGLERGAESPRVGMPDTLGLERGADTQPCRSGSGVGPGSSGSGPNLIDESETAAMFSCGSDLVPPSNPLQEWCGAAMPQVGYQGTVGLASAPEGVSDTQVMDSCSLLLPAHQPPEHQEQQQKSPRVMDAEEQHLKPAQTDSSTATPALNTPALKLLVPQQACEQQGQSLESSMTPDGLVPMDAEGHVQPDAEGHVPLDAEGHYVLVDAADPLGCAVSVEGEDSCSQPCTVRMRRGQKARRLESSDSELSSEDEDLPSLQQIFRPRAPPQPISQQGRSPVNPTAPPQPISQQGRGSVNPTAPPQPISQQGRGPVTATAPSRPISQQGQGQEMPSLTPDEPEREASECDVIPCSLEPPPPSRHCPPKARREISAKGEGTWHGEGEEPDEWVGSSQGSQDLFGTPEEDDPNHISTEATPLDGERSTEATAGEFSQYSSDIINTQQKAEMQAELQRLEQMMSLVSEALKQKEAEPGPKAVGVVRAEAANGIQGTEPMASSLRSPKHRLSSNLDEQRNTHTREHTPSREGGSAGLTASPPDGLGPTPPTDTQRCTPPQGRRCTRRSGRRDNSGSQRSEGIVERSPAAASTRPHPLQLVLSGLSGPQQVEVKRLAKRMGGSVTPQVTSSTTHVIIRTDDGLVCERTLKYFQGIANRKWVVSYLWVSECLRQEKLVDEAEFEVCGDVVNGRNHRGPQKARCTQPNNLLMRGFEICFYGPFTGMTTGQMQDMVELCGGVVVENPIHFSRRCSSQLLIVQSDPESETDFRVRDLPRSALVVNRGWLLDSIATYTLHDLDNY